MNHESPSSLNVDNTTTRRFKIANRRANRSLDIFELVMFECQQRRTSLTEVEYLTVRDQPVQTAINVKLLSDLLARCEILKVTFLVATQ